MGIKSGHERELKRESSTERAQQRELKRESSIERAQDRDQERAQERVGIKRVP